MTSAEYIRLRCAEYRAWLIATGRLRPNRLRTPFWIDQLPYLPEHDA